MGRTPKRRQIRNADDARALLTSDPPAADPSKALRGKAAEELAARMRPREFTGVVPILVSPLNIPARRVLAEFVCYVDRGWLAFGEVSRTWAGGLVISELTIAPAFEDDLSIDHSVMRQIKPALLLDAIRNDAELRSEIGSLFAQQSGVETGKDLEALKEVATAALRKRGRRRVAGRLPDELIEAVARLYLQAQAEGFGRGIRREIAQRLGLPNESLSRIGDLIQTAKDRGFLEGGRPGRAGDVRPGPKLRTEGGNSEKMSDTPKPRGRS